MKIFQQPQFLNKNNTQVITQTIKYNMPAKNNNADTFIKSKNVSFKAGEQDILQKFLNNPELRSNLAKFLAEGLTAGLASFIALKEVKAETSSKNDEMQAVIDAKDKEIQAWQEYYENTAEIEENHQPIETDSKYTYHAQKEKELYEAFLSNADEQIKAINDEAVELLMKNDELTETEEKNRAEINKLQQENQTLTDNNKEKDTQLNTLQQENKSLAENKRQSEVQAKRLTDENKGLRAKEKESREKSETYKKSLHKLQNSYDSLNRSYTETNRRYREALESVAYINEQNQNLRFDNQDLTSGLKAALSENENLKTQLEQLQKDYEQLAEEKEKKEIQISMDNIEKDKNIKRLNKENYEMSLLVVNTEEKNKKLQQENHRVKKTNADFAKQISQINYENNLLKTQIEELKETIKILKTDNNENIIEQENNSIDTENTEMQRLPFPKKHGRLSGDEEILKDLVNGMSQNISVNLNNQLVNFCSDLMYNKLFTDEDAIIGNKTLIKKFIDELSTGIESLTNAEKIETTVQIILNQFKKYNIAQQNKMFEFKTGRTDKLQHSFKSIFRKFISDYQLKKGQNLKQKQSINDYIKITDIIAEIKRHNDWENITEYDAQELSDIINNNPKIKDLFCLHSAMRFIDRMVDFHDRYTPLEEKANKALDVFERSLQNALKNGVNYTFYEESHKNSTGKIISYYTPVILLNQDNFDEDIKKEFEDIFGNQQIHVSVVNEYNPEEKDNTKYHRKKLIGTIYKLH